MVHPPKNTGFATEHNVIAGNVIGYGATGGEIYLSGLVGERFCVRNSGVTAVVEGVGDHGCEYMTGGQVLILGPVGRNFAAGMSGGLAFVYDPKRELPMRLNKEMVELEKPDVTDMNWLKHHVTRHHSETGSALADRLLSNWIEICKHFVKVTPNDYKRVMLATAKARAEGNRRTRRCDGLSTRISLSKLVYHTFSRCIFTLYNFLFYIRLYQIN